MLHTYNNEIYKFIRFVKYYSFLDIVVKVRYNYKISTLLPQFLFYDIEFS